MALLPYALLLQPPASLHMHITHIIKKRIPFTYHAPHHTLTITVITTDLKSPIIDTETYLDLYYTLV